MDKLTEKLRTRILFALPELTLEEAERIAAINGCSSKTVYRWMKRIKEGSDELNNITLAIAELAASKIEIIRKTKRKQVRIMKQLSAA